MTNEDDWQVLENSYTQFILLYAMLAQEIDAELFCIGTELEKFIEKRPQYWSNLIKEIKKVYKGKLTYAANWDEFKRTPFWSDLDYIVAPYQVLFKTKFLYNNRKSRLKNIFSSSSFNFLIIFLRFHPVAAKKALICDEFLPLR